MYAGIYFEYVAGNHDPESREIASTSNHHHSFVKHFVEALCEDGVGDGVAPSIRLSIPIALFCEGIPIELESHH